ncbi:MAG: ammonium transporter [Saprospiraceae bacterium]
MKEMITSKPLASAIFLAFLIISIFAALYPVSHPGLPEGVTLNSGDVAWMLVASGLVLLMTPGLSFFYGGMVHPKNIISTMLQSFIALGFISFLWYVVGFSLAFGDSIGGFIGNPMSHLFFDNVGIAPHQTIATGIPFMLFAIFQLKFAIITPALITGSFAERVRFWGYIIFMGLWSLLIYCPLAHWTWHPDGFLFKMGVLDFAGGTVVHIAAGSAAFVGALVLGRRKSHKEGESFTPVNTPYVLLGTGLLWFGWFGFNAGSAVAANGQAIDAFINTNIASATAMIGWMLVDLMRGRKPRALGASIGAVVGLVAITPAAGYVALGPSVFIGFIAAVVSNYAVVRKARTALDDTLDVFPCHGIGGIVGMLLTAVFALNGGLLTSGSPDLLFKHLLALAIVLVYTSVGSWLVYKVTALITPLRVSEAQEVEGLDLSQHDETVGFKDEEVEPSTSALAAALS